MVTYAKMSPEMLNPRDIAKKAEEKDAEIVRACNLQTELFKLQASFTI